MSKCGVNVSRPLIPNAISDSINASSSFFNFNCRSLDGGIIRAHHIAIYATTHHCPSSSSTSWLLPPWKKSYSSKNVKLTPVLLLPPPSPPPRPLPPCPPWPPLAAPMPHRNYLVKARRRRRRRPRVDPRDGLRLLLLVVGVEPRSEAGMGSIRCTVAFECGIGASGCRRSESRGRSRGYG